MWQHEKLLDCTLVLVAVRAHKDCGMCPLCIDSVPSPIPISGPLMIRFFPASGIKVSAKKVAKLATLNGLTAPYGNGFQDWFARPYHFPKKWRITSVQSGTSFTTTTYPYLLRTTRSFCKRLSCCSTCFLKSGERTLKSMVLSNKQNVFSIEAI